MDEILEKFELAYWTAMAENDRPRAQMINREYQKYAETSNSITMRKLALNAKWQSGSKMLDAIDDIQETLVSHIGTRNIKLASKAIAALEDSVEERCLIHNFCSERSNNKIAAKLIESSDYLEDTLMKDQDPKLALCQYGFALKNLREAIVRDMEKIAGKVRN